MKTAEPFPVKKTFLYSLVASVRLSTSDLAPMSDGIATVETEDIDEEIARLKERIAELERMKHAEV